jgi:monoamine oxidase
LWELLLWVRFRPEGVQVATENAQDRKFVGGAQQISDKLAEALQGRVVLNAPVASIEWSPERGAAVCHAISVCLASRDSDRRGVCGLSAATQERV